MFRIAPGASQRRPHLRRWAESELNEAKSFWFRGPDQRLKLRAGIRDETLAGQVAAIEQEATEQGLAAKESRRRIVAAIRERYLAGRA